MAGPIDNFPEFLPYGEALYGDDLYGEGQNIYPIVITDCLSEQSGYCPAYVRFQFSGVNLGLYIFEQNPLSYDIYPQRTTKAYSYIIDSNTTVDETYKKIEIELRWDYMPESMWNQIMTYSRKRVDGRSEELYFWDANLGRFCGRQVKMEGISAEVRGGYNPPARHNVVFKLREI